MWHSFETEKTSSADGTHHVARIANEGDKPVKGVRITQIREEDQPGTSHPMLGISAERYLVEYDTIRDEVILTFRSPVSGEVAL